MPESFSRRSMSTTATAFRSITTTGPSRALTEQTATMTSWVSMYLPASCLLTWDPPGGRCAQVRALICKVALKPTSLFAPPPPARCCSGGTWSDSCTPVIVTGRIKEAAAASIEHNMLVANCGLPNGQANKINMGMCASGSQMTLSSAGVIICDELTSECA